MFEKVYWGISDRLLIVKYSSHLTEQDTKQASSEVLSLLNETHVAGAVHIIFDATNVTEISLKINAFVAQKHAKTTLSHPSIGWSVLVYSQASNPYLTYLTDIVMKILKINIKLVPTLDDAILHLNAVDPILFREWESAKVQ